MLEKDLSDILAGDEVEEIKIEYKGNVYEFKIRELPWTKINNLISRCVQFEKKKVIPDLGEFYLLYLESALVSAPWPLDQTRIYLKRLDRVFGRKLEEFLPNPFGIDEDEELKKE